MLGALLIEKELLIANGRLVGTGLEENLGDTSSYAVGLQTATAEVNLIHKARYSVQLSVVPICVCLKKLNNSVLPPYLWAKERSLFSRWFKYWMLSMKFQIDYLVSIRSMRKGNFKLFDKTLISLDKIFDQCNYVRWLSVHIQDLLILPITHPQLYQEFEGYFVAQISGSRF